jgi:hypothetical protein
MKNDNKNKDLNLLDVINNYVPTEEDEELYKHLLEVLKNYEPETITSKS